MPHIQARCPRSLRARSFGRASHAPSAIECLVAHLFAHFTFHFALIREPKKHSDQQYPHRPTLHTWRSEGAKLPKDQVVAKVPAQVHRTRVPQQA